jgi:high-affinity Fe2+/Pb2+ permease
MSELDAIGQHRLTRILQSTRQLPNVLWCVLLVGGFLTIVSACTFGTDSLKLQILQVFCLSVLVSLSLVAIADIHRPFHGLVHVSDYAFRRAQQSM